MECEKKKELIEKNYKKQKKIEEQIEKENKFGIKEKANKLNQTINFLEGISSIRILNSYENEIEIELIDTKFENSKKNLILFLSFVKSENSPTKLSLSGVSILPEISLINDFFKELIKVSIELNDVNFLILEIRNKLKVSKLRKKEFLKLQSKYKVTFLSMNSISVVFPKSSSVSFEIVLELDEDYPRFAYNCVHLIQFTQTKNLQTKNLIEFLKKKIPLLLNPSQNISPNTSSCNILAFPNLESAILQIKKLIE